MEYTFALALVDFLPVLFAGFGFFYIVRLVSFILPAQGRIALLGGSLIVFGGLFKAVWKLLMASSGGAVNLTWLENSLFILMTPGYLLLAWSVWQAARAAQGKRTYHAWMLPIAGIVLLFLISFYLYEFAPESPAWERLLLTVMVFATFLTGILLIVFASRLKLPLAAGLFLVNLLLVLVLNGLARQSEQPISLQWVEEIINTVSWLAFALGARILYQYARLNFGLDTPTTPRKTAVAE